MNHGNSQAMGLNQEQVAVGFGDEVALQQVSHGCGTWVMEGAVTDIGVPGASIMVLATQ